MKSICFNLIVLISGLFLSSPSFSTDYKLMELLHTAVERHPQIEADRYGVEAASHEVTIAKSGYFPNLAGMGIASSGFPGSSGALRMGGLTGSSYRKGPSVDLVLEQIIWDFGRTSSKIEVAKKEKISASFASQASSFQIEYELIPLFFNCSKNRTISEITATFLTDVRGIVQEVDRFVQTGQESIVDRYLSQVVIDEIATDMETYKKKYEMDLLVLKEYIGPGNVQDSCPLLSETLLNEIPKNNSDAVIENPYVKIAKAELDVSAAKNDLAKSQYWPKVIGLASVGYLQNTQLAEVKKQNYALAIGVILPIFDLTTIAGADRTEAKRMQKGKELESIKFHVETTLQLIEKNIASSSIEKSHLLETTKVSEKAFKLAKKRYFGKEGTLIDLREATRTYERIQTKLKETEATLSSNLALKSLLLGAFVR